ncbi:hypothetical protein DM860_004360 [Cuscuta australis]|uniref:Uncharacterized protein n=1 Tax=Cuscuta australis TaxID=267555 RepID=A0A328EBE9_9ASTE|nr:hypothetical protein DM860_004360 [Cuscuta australis]
MHMPPPSHHPSNVGTWDYINFGVGWMICQKMSGGTGSWDTLWDRGSRPGFMHTTTGFAALSLSLEEVIIRCGFNSHKNGKHMLSLLVKPTVCSFVWRLWWYNHITL